MPMFYFLVNGDSLNPVIAGADLLDLKAARGEAAQVLAELVLSSEEAWESQNVTVHDETRVKLFTMAIKETWAADHGGGRQCTDAPSSPANDSG
jgi:hypothetical protein